MQEIFAMVCETCKRKNYTTSKNKKNIKERIGLLKFCPWCKKHTKHKEEK